MPKNRIPGDLQVWIDARKRFQLSHAHVQMARELGLNPKKFGKLANQDNAAERRRLAAKKAAMEKTRREREAAIARAKYLEEIAGHEPEIWLQVESLITTKQTASYDSAVELLVDLRDLAERRGETDESRMRVEALRATHTRRPALMERMRKAGLLT